MRITDSAMTQSYLKNLQRNMSNLSSSNLKLASGRKFNHVSEDTGSAARAFAVRDQMAKNTEYTSTIENAIGELDTADDALMSVSSILKEVYQQATTAAGGSKSESQLGDIAQELNGLKNEIVQTMNAKYGDKFLFSGSSNGEAPFTIDADGKLLFNGTDVDSALAGTDFKENNVVYLDIGFGMTSAAGGINNQTGIKISTSGVDVLGFGADENGEPNNIYSLISKMEEQIKNGDLDGMGETMAHLKRSEDNLSTSVAEVGTRQKILDRTKDRLESEGINLKARQQSLEAVSLESESIDNSNYKMAWMVTLQLGSSIIPSSIFDFMR